MSAYNGGPAFPHTPGRTEPTGVGDFQHFTPGELPGMSLRDYFAAKALQGLMADPGLIGNTEQVAQVAYRIADAMLKAREASE